MRSLFQDIRYARRMMFKNPAFTAVAVLALALGIGANTAIFSVVNAVMLRPLPYEKPHELVTVVRASEDGGTTSESVSMTKFVHWRDNNTVFEGLAAYDVLGAGGDRPERIRGIRRSPVRRGAPVDVLELGVPIRMRRALPGLAVCLQTVVERTEQRRHHPVTGPVPQVRQLLGEVPHALPRPSQGRLRISPRGRLHQQDQVLQQGRVRVDRPFASRAGLADAPWPWAGRLGQLAKTHADGTPRHPGRARHRRHAAPPERLDFRRGDTAPQPLVKQSLQ